MKKFNRVFYPLFPLFVATIISLSLQQQQKEVYTLYHLPWGMPSQWVFGVVWSVLYLLLGYSMFLIYYEPRTNVTYVAGGILVLQFVMNFLWCFVFFLFHQLQVAMIWNLVILLLALVNCWFIYDQKKSILWFHLPYVLWLLYANYLSIAIYVLNR